MKSCCVIIPIHRSYLYDDEYENVKNTIKKLNSYDIYVIGPESLNITYYTNLFNNQLKFKLFKDKYFTSTCSYSYLLSRVMFYESFINYEYMLIAQPDSYVFNDQIQYWCSKNFDYIGAPIFFDQINEVSDVLNRINNKYVCHTYNGGFSLRNIRKIHKYLLNNEQELDKYGNLHYDSNGKIIIDNEDGLICHLVRKNNSVLPNIQDALLFSLETYYVDLFMYSNTIPFGCHGFMAIEYFKNKQKLV